MIHVSHQSGKTEEINQKFSVLASFFDQNYIFNQRKKKLLFCEKYIDYL